VEHKSADRQSAVGNKIRRSMPDMTAAVVTGMALIMSACGVVGASDDRAVDPGVSDRRSATAPSDLAFTDDDLAATEDGLVIAVVGPIGTVPAEVSMGNQGEVIVTDLLFDGLTEADGWSESLVPALASGWEANDSFDEWIFELDPERISAEEVISHFEGLDGAAHNPNVAQLVDLVASVEKVDGLSDPESVRFSLTRSEAGFAWLLSGLSASIAGPDGEPTGQYRAIDQSDDGMTLGSENGPDIGIVWTEDEPAAYKLLVDHSVDGAVVSGALLDDAEADLESMPPVRSITRFYGINRDSERLSDSSLVEALLAAVDRNQLVDRALDVETFSTNGAVPPSLIGYELSGCGRFCDYDPDKAKRLVAYVTLKQKAAPELRIGFSGDTQEPVAAEVARQLAEAGFDVSIEQLTGAALIRKVAADEIDLFSYGSVAPTSSLDGSVLTTFASTSSSNLVGVDNENIDIVLRIAATEGDDQKRWELLSNVHARVMAEHRILPLAVAKSHLVVDPDLGYVMVRPDGSIDLSQG